MRTWVLLLFCVVVIAAVANAQKQGNGAGKEDREKGKKVEGKEVKKDGKINRQKSNGNGNRERNKLEKANNRERNSKKNEGKDGKGPQKAKDRTIKTKSERDPKNKRPRNGGKVQNKPKKVGDRNKSLKKKEGKSSKQLKKTKSKQDCPGECVAEGDCQGRSKRGMMCDDDQVCCLPKRNRAVKKGTSVKRFCKPLSLCSDMEGECRKKKQGCNLDEKRYKNKKNKAYCDKKSCYCCVKQCKSRGKCLKQGGTCMLKKASKKLCAGDFVMGKNYCDGKKCGCCIPGGPSPSCKQKKTCTKEGGECVPLGSSCSGEIKTVNSNGKNYCKGSCGCCLEESTSNVTASHNASSNDSVTGTILNGYINNTVSTRPLYTVPILTHEIDVTFNSSLNSTSLTNPVPTEDTIQYLDRGCNMTRAICNDCRSFSVDTADTRIVQGIDAQQNEFPYQVHIFLVLNTSYRWCGGSIISEHWILTAAHCFFVDYGYQILLEYYEVGYGNVDINELTRIRPKDRVIHEKYTHLVDNFAYDIALLELEDSLQPFNPSIQPICLGEETDIPFGGKALVTGWGTLEYGGSHPTILQKVALDVINNTYCASLENLPTDHNTVVCALTDYKDSCQGDSGGPLVAKICPNLWVQIGIVSYGYECARPNHPGVYTRVSTFRDWIISKTGISKC